MKNKALWSCFDDIYCLTLEGDIARQRHASAELCRAGLDAFKFIEGVKADSDEVRDTFRDGKVFSFPPCFRCGMISCGSDDCNNVIIPPQVGCFLSFLKLFKMAAASKSTTFLVVEDDVRFHDYAAELASVAFTRTELDALGFFSDEPCLIGLGRGVSQDENLTFEGEFKFLSRRKQPQNPCFAFNKAFAQLALDRFYKINHTADTYIHFEISNEARHYSLEPPLSYELSTSTGELPSKIHPKRTAFENASCTDAERAVAKAAFDAHLKHVKWVPLVVLGGPRGGTGFMAHALGQFGLDVGHEALGSDGVSSWMFAVDDVDLPYGGDLYARNSKFVFAEKTIAVVRTDPKAIFSLQIENSKSVQSFAFRRRWIKRYFDVDIDAFSTDFERALAAYVFWYRIIELRKPTAWICLERAEQDLARVFDANILQRRRDPDPSSMSEPVNARKPYLGQIYDPVRDDFDQLYKASDRFLQEQYTQLKSDLFSKFYGHR